MMAQLLLLRTTLPDATVKFVIKLAKCSRSVLSSGFPRNMVEARRLDGML